MLPIWDPARLGAKVSYVCAAVGGRRMGKSTLVTHLLRQSKKFDLVISFTGTTACSPEMAQLMENRWDPRFQFAEWRQPLVNALLKQQERLKKEGVNRQVAILVDDIVLSSKDEDALAHLCLRGRHFNISVLACAVSYTTLPKRCRRALDVLFLFSYPMAGDCQILCQEYANRSRMARYLLTQLPPWTCLVMETLERRQRLYHYRVLCTGSQRLGSSSDAPSETQDAAVTDEENHEESRPQSNNEPLGCTPGAESHESDAAMKSERYDPLSQT